MGSNGPLKKSVSESSGATAGLPSSVFPGVSPRTAGQASSGTLVHRAAKLGLACGVFCAVAVTIGGGCGGDRGPPRAVVSGTITYQGKPVETGEIRFIPTKGSKGPMSFAPIIDGKYRVAVRGGAVVGAAKVEITGYRSDPNYKAPPPDERERPGIGGPRRAEPPKTQYLPAKYNSQSELETTIEGGSGEITRDFTLTD